MTIGRWCERWAHHRWPESTYTRWLSRFSIFLVFSDIFCFCFRCLSARPTNLKLAKSNASMHSVLADGNERRIIGRFVWTRNIVLLCNKNNKIYPRKDTHSRLHSHHRFLCASTACAVPCTIQYMHAPILSSCTHATIHAIKFRLQFRVFVHCAIFTNTSNTSISKQQKQQPATSSSIMHQRKIGDYLKLIFVFDWHEVMQFPAFHAQYRAHTYTHRLTSVFSGDLHFCWHRSA